MADDTTRLDYINLLRANAEQYHDQKDKMAYAVCALILGFAAAYYAADMPPRYFRSTPCLMAVFTILLASFWGLAHFILCFQLVCKRIAAEESRGFTNALNQAHLGGEKLDETIQSLCRAPPPSVCKILSLHRSASSTGDHRIEKGPAFLIAALKEARSEGTLSRKVEWATYLLSVFALVTLLAKTWIPVPTFVE